MNFQTFSLDQIELSEEQKDCLRYSGKKNPDLCIKGRAGSGKSLVLQIAARDILAKREMGQTHKAALFTYNQTLADYSAEVLRLTSEDREYLTIGTLNRYVTDLFVSMHGPSWRSLDSQSGRDRELRQRLMMKAQQSALEKLGGSLGARLFSAAYIQKLTEEFQWMRDMDLSPDEKDREIYLQIEREGRSSMHLEKKERGIVFAIYADYERRLHQMRRCEWEDRDLFVSHNLEKIPEEMKYDIILLDEAQDQSLPRMRTAVAAYRNRMLFSMDSGQRIYRHFWKNAQTGARASTKNLRKSFRCSQKIEALAESVRKHNDPFLKDEEIPERIRPEQPGSARPKVIACADYREQKTYLTNLLRAYLQENPGATVGVLCPRRNQVRTLSEWCMDASIPHEQILREGTYQARGPGVKITTIHSAKGMEFRLVILPFFEEEFIPGWHVLKIEDPKEKQDAMVQARNLAYVAMTRAMDGLVIFYTRQPSCFVGEMDPKLYDFQGSALPESKLPESCEESLRKKENENGKGQKPEPGAETETQKENGASPESLTPQKAGAWERRRKSLPGLTAYFRYHGYSVIDRRPEGGDLWVIAEKNDRTFRKHLVFARDHYGASGIWNEGDSLTGGRMAWHTKSEA